MSNENFLPAASVMPWMKAEHACCVLCGVELQENHDLLVCQVHAAQVLLKNRN